MRLTIEQALLKRAGQLPADDCDRILLEEAAQTISRCSVALAQLSTVNDRAYEIANPARQLIAEPMWKIERR
ncbi:MAG: hypothetical protein K9N51_11555 [Candidatus Pacebacteria bacterium]|nr:hypothetical protein [Candidatus Paceibacterota bacterium]